MLGVGGRTSAKLLSANEGLLVHLVFKLSRWPSAASPGPLQLLLAEHAGTVGVTSLLVEDLLLHLRIRAEPRKPAFFPLSCAAPRLPSLAMNTGTLLCLMMWRIAELPISTPAGVSRLEMLVSPSTKAVPQN